MQSLYANVPGARLGTGDLSSYYLYRTLLDISIYLMYH